MSTALPQPSCVKRDCGHRMSDGLAYEWSNSIANALGLPQSTQEVFNIVRDVLSYACDFS